MNKKLIFEQVCAIVKEASQLIKEIKRSDIQIKSQGNFVTSIDFAVDAYLKKKLGELLPEAGFFSEESGSDIRETNWIIDPIDGTGNMIYGYPYTVSVALACNEEVELGVVYHVPMEELYCAIKGMGAYKQSAYGVMTKIHVGHFDGDEGVSIVGFPYDRSKTHQILSAIEKIYPFSSDIKRIGPASLDICAVAEGRAKMYVELDLQWWDYAAGEVILKEAGGDMLVNNDILIFAADRNIINAMKDLFATD